jgi:LAO/AO transport system kinase
VPSVIDLFERIGARDPHAIARAATLIENAGTEGWELVRLIDSHTGRARTIGVTGPPGAGKSTLANAMTRLLRQSGKTVAIVAVDASSLISGGALLGDRIRMQEHYHDSGVFVRSLAARGHSGGLAEAALPVAALFDFAGFDVVIIETVGVGQDEVEICGKVDVTIAVFAGGLGDEVQAIKAGLMETADIFAINKADLPGAETAEQLIREVQSLADHTPETAPVRHVVATDGTGVDELLRLALEMPSRRKVADTKPNAMAIDHLGIAVGSIEEAEKFYAAQLGLATIGRETVEGERVHAAMLPVGEARIELLEGSEPDSTIARFIAKRGPGLHHIALKVPELTAVVEKIKAAGGRILNEPRTGAGGHLYVFVHPETTGGVLVELIQA